MTEEASEEWKRYGSAVIAAMDEVLKEKHEEHHPVMLETADYWLSLGLVIGLRQPDEGRRLLHLIEANEHNRAELETEAGEFIREALG